MKNLHISLMICRSEGMPIVNRLTFSAEGRGSITTILEEGHLPDVCKNVAAIADFLDAELEIKTSKI